MPVVVTPADRQSFRRCRRQWDLRARMRRGLEPVAPPTGPDLAAAVHAALAVYYFPGMWDWDRAITIPLVLQAFDRETARQRERRPDGEAAPDWPAHVAAGHDLLRRYAAWAHGVDRFSPVLIDSDYDVQVLDAGRAGSGLTGPDGQPVRFRGRIHMLAVDEHDTYWLVRHTVRTGGWLDTGELTSDETACADAWAWEQFYPGMVIAGTIYNELLADARPPAETDSPDSPPSAAPAGRRGRRVWWPRRAAWPRRLPWPPGRSRRAAGPPEARSPAGAGGSPLVRQHEPSGGGRSIPQHRRMDARAREPVAAEAAEPVSTIQEVSTSERASAGQPGTAGQPGSAGKPGTTGQPGSAGGFRRTWVRHSRAAVTLAGQRLAADAAAMLAAGPSAPPNPSDANCRPCEFLPPCLAMRAGRDSDFLLRSGYRQRSPDGLQEGRLGGSSWGTGRGAAPFRGRA